MDASFSVGDKAVYPAHGVAEIVGIEAREIGGAKQSFYILKILETGMKIMIPTIISKTPAQISPQRIKRL